jgi:hypothetical protein
MMPLLSLILISGCAMPGAGDCGAWRRLVFGEPALSVMTLAEARAVLAHDLTGQRLGCW